MLESYKSHQNFNNWCRFFCNFWKLFRMLGCVYAVWIVISREKIIFFPISLQLYARLQIQLFFFFCHLIQISEKYRFRWRYFRFKFGRRDKKKNITRWQLKMETSKNTMWTLILLSRLLVLSINGQHWLTCLHQ